jgi:hypothetical protein
VPTSEGLVVVTYTIILDYDASVKVSRTKKAGTVGITTPFFVAVLKE